MFGSGSIYANFNWFWLIGALLPLTLWVMTRKLGLGFARHLNAPIMLGAMAWLPPATPLSFWSWALFGLLFNYYIKKRFNGWWSTYNYITAAGLDAGLIISTIVIFFAITLPNVTIPQWWGNVDVFNTLVSSCRLMVWHHESCANRSTGCYLYGRAQNRAGGWDVWPEDLVRVHGLSGLRRCFLGSCARITSRFT